VPTSIPEIALLKKTDQKGVAKVAVFAELFRKSSALRAEVEDKLKKLSIYIGSKVVVTEDELNELLNKGEEEREEKRKSKMVFTDISSIET
jgi:hypothetical protein